MSGLEVLAFLVGLVGLSCACGSVFGYFKLAWHAKNNVQFVDSGQHRDPTAGPRRYVESQEVFEPSVFRWKAPKIQSVGVVGSRGVPSEYENMEDVRTYMEMVSMLLTNIRRIGILAQIIVE